MLMHIIHWLLLHTCFWIELGYTYKIPSLSQSVKNKESVNGQHPLPQDESGFMAQEELQVVPAP